MTVKEAVQFAEVYLAERAIQLPRQDAELLVASVLQRDRAFLYGHPERELLSAQECLFYLWLTKRGAHYPLQYLRGKQEFYGREFIVRPGVFIPRPETELLVETGITLLQGKSDDRLRVADVGTGSGCIAITLACEDPRVALTAIDASPQALELARQNTEVHRCCDRVEFFRGDTLSPAIDRHSYFDLILCNPPYVSWRDHHLVELSVKRYEPSQAVFAGDSGLEVYKKVFRQGRSALHPQGALVLELGHECKNDVTELGRLEGWALSRVRVDLAGIDRCAVFQQSPQGTQEA